MFSHGTLMFNTEIEKVVSALRVRKDKIESKGIKSIRSRVANITEFLEEGMTIEDLRLEILKSIFDGEENIQYKELTEEDWENIHELSKERYANWDWNYGKSPKFNMQHTHRFPVGSIDVRLQVSKGVIEDIAIFGDFFGIGEIEKVQAALRGVTYSKTAIEEALVGVDIPTYLGGISTEEFVQLIY